MEENRLYPVSYIFIDSCVWGGVCACVWVYVGVCVWMVGWVGERWGCGWCGWLDVCMNSLLEGMILGCS